MSSTREPEKKSNPLQTINQNNKKLRTPSDIKTFILDPLTKNAEATKLFLKNTGLTGKSLATLLKSIKCHKGINALNLRENNLKDDQSVFGLILDTFPNLVELDLNLTKMNTKGIDSIITHLKRVGSHSKLQRLDIGFNYLGDTALISLLTTIKSNSLEVTPIKWDLRLTGNELTDKTADELIKLISSECLCISYLNIQDNPKISPDKIEKLTSLKFNPKIVQAIEQRPSSHIFDFSGRNLSSQDMRRITNTLQQDPQVRTILLAHNTFNEAASIELLCHAIQRHGNITELDLSHNNIGLEGAKSLSRGISEVKELKTLRLAHNKLGPREAEELARIIRAQSPALHQLDLEDNQLGDEGVSILADALIGHPSLLTLNIKENQMTNRSALKILALFQQNGRLQNEGKLVPLHDIQLSRASGISQAVYNAIILAVRQYGWLPYQRSLCLAHAAILAKNILMLDAEVTLIDFIYKWAEEEDFSKEKSILLNLYGKAMDEWMKELFKNAENYLKERCAGDFLKKELDTTQKRILSIITEYADPAFIAQGFYDISNFLRQLSIKKDQLKEQHLTAKEALVPYVEEEDQLKEEINQARAWHLLLSAVPTDLPLEKMQGWLDTTAMGYIKHSAPSSPSAERKTSVETTTGDLLLSPAVPPSKEKIEPSSPSDALSMLTSSKKSLFSGMPDVKAQKMIDETRSYMDLLISKQLLSKEEQNQLSSALNIYQEEASTHILQQQSMKALVTIHDQLAEKVKKHLLAFAK